MHTTTKTHSAKSANAAVLAAEASLVARAKAGDNAAFTQLLKGCRGKLLGSMTHFCGNRELAEDAVQSASILAWEQLSTHFRGESAFATWFYKVAKNCVTYVKRREQRYTSDPCPEQIAATSMRADYLLMAEERVERFEARFETLSDLEKEIFDLHFENGFTTEVISQSLVMSAAKVGSVLRRIRRHLAIGKNESRPSEDPDYFDYQEQPPMTAESEFFDDVALDDGYGPDVAEPEWPSDLGFGGCDDDE